MRRAKRTEPKQARKRTSKQTNESYRTEPCSGKSNITFFSRLKCNEVKASQSKPKQAKANQVKETHKQLPPPLLPCRTTPQPIQANLLFRRRQRRRSGMVMMTFSNQNVDSNFFPSSYLQKSRSDSTIQTAGLDFSDRHDTNINKNKNNNINNNINNDDLLLSFDDVLLVETTEEGKNHIKEVEEADVMKETQQTSAFPNKSTKRQVRFGNIHFRIFPIMLGDNPACSRGPPVRPPFFFFFFVSHFVFCFYFFILFLKSFLSFSSLFLSVCFLFLWAPFYYFISPFSVYGSSSKRFFLSLDLYLSQQQPKQRKQKTKPK